MRIKMLYRPDEHTIFASTAFEKNIGKTVRVNLTDGSVEPGKLVAAMVADDGRSVEFTLELPDVEGLFPADVDDFRIDVNG